jgi:hypothetical protein
LPIWYTPSDDVLNLRDELSKRRARPRTNVRQFTRRRDVLRSQPDGSVLKITSSNNIVFEVTSCDSGMPTSSFFYNMCTLSVPVN